MQCEAFPDAGQLDVFKGYGNRHTLRFLKGAQHHLQQWKISIELLAQHMIACSTSRGL